MLTYAGRAWRSWETTPLGRSGFCLGKSDWASLFLKEVSAAFGPVDPETLSFGLDRAHAKVFFDQRLILQEAVRHQAQFATVFQMFGCFSQQVLGREIICVHPDMERWVTQNRTQTHRRGIDAITGNHLGFQTVGGANPWPMPSQSR